MKDMIISFVVAVAANGIIGKDNDLPWRLPADLARFKKITMGKPIIMGRKTYESIGRPLSGRHNIVLTHDRNAVFEGCIVTHGVEEALSVAAGIVNDNGEVMVIGGSGVFEAFLPAVKRIYLTEIDSEFEGDVYFSEINMNEWHEVSRESFKATENNPFDYHFVLLEKLADES